MILAVADYATEQSKQPPPELSEAFMTRNWGLPFGGGWKEQPPGFLDRVSYLLNIYDACRGHHKAMGDNVVKWAERNPGKYRTWQMVMKLRGSLDG